MPGLSPTHGLRYALIALSLCVLTACQTPGYKKAESATAGMVQLRQELLASKQQIDITLGALNRLVGQPTLDLRQPFNEYRRQVSAMRSQGQRTGSRADSMWASGQSYLDAWDRELASMGSASMRQRSEQRRVEIIREYQMLARMMVATRDAFQPFLADLDDIERGLSSDLTRAGLQTVAPLAEKAAQDGDYVKRRIDQVLGQLDKVGRSLAQQG
jgi:hypothetical protein